MISIGNIRLVFHWTIWPNKNIRKIAHKPNMIKRLTSKNCWLHKLIFKKGCNECLTWTFQGFFPSKSSHLLVEFIQLEHQRNRFEGLPKFKWKSLCVCVSFWLLWTNFSSLGYTLVQNVCPEWKTAENQGNHYSFDPTLFSFFKIANSRNFFAKISWICPWDSRID